MRLDVYAERGAGRALVGSIETVQAAGERFTYSRDWLASRREPLSLSLQLQEEPFPAKGMRPYFDGLLPEGAAREALAKTAQTSPRSYVKLLAALGDECIGAVSFGVPDDAFAGAPDGARAESYAPFTSEDLEALARRGYELTTPINRRAHMSLAGAQAKVGLYRAEDDQPGIRGKLSSTRLVVFRVTICPGQNDILKYMRFSTCCKCFPSSHSTGAWKVRVVRRIGVA